MSTEFEYLKEGITTDLIEYLMTDYDLDIRGAMHIIYESDTYSKLCEPATGLYFQGSRYVYSYLQEELQNGKIA